MTPLLAGMVLVLGACGSDPLPVATGTAPGREDAWLELLAARGLEPAERAVPIAVSGEAPELAVTVGAPAEAQGELTFADALFGAEAYAFEDGGWRRVDTADFRAELAPILRPGEEATVRLPVREADGYRVLVPVLKKAAWADAARP